MPPSDEKSVESEGHVLEDGRFREHLFDAVYLDTNALRDLGLRLTSDWFDKLKDACDQAKVPLCVVSLSLHEWAAHIIEQVRTKSQKVRESLRFVEQASGLTITGASSIVPPIEPKAIASQLRLLLTQRGVHETPMRPKELTQYLVDAVFKTPPFETGGKGLCDAVILDSACGYAKTLAADPQILVVSRDKALCESASRCKESGVRAIFAEPSAAAKVIEDSLSTAEAALLVERQEHLLKYVKTFEQQIIEGITRSGVAVSDFAVRSALKDGEEKFVTIRSIVGLRPRRVVYVTPYVGLDEALVGRNRLRLSVSVEAEIDLRVTQPGLGGLFTSTTLMPERIHPEEGVRLSSDREPMQWVTHIITRTITISIEASVQRDAFEAGRLSGFRVDAPGQEIAAEPSSSASAERAAIAGELAVEAKDEAPKS